MNRRVLLIVVVAVLARAAMLTLFDALPPSVTNGDTPLFIAQSLDPLKHGFEPPGYPLLLSAVLPLSPMAVVLLQTISAVGLAVFTYRRTQMLGLSLAIAGCPFLIIFDFQLLTEAMTCQLVWLALLLLAWPRRSFEPILAGALLGAAALTRDTLYFMPILLILATIRTSVLRVSFLAFACAFLTVLPWQLAHGTPKISDGRGGFALWIGTWERNGDWQLPGIQNAAWPAEAFRSTRERQQVVQAIANRNETPLTAIALDRIRSEPGSVLKTWALRYPRLWVGTRVDSLQMRFPRNGTAWFASKLGFLTLDVMILVLALVGAWRLRHDPRSRLVSVPIIYLGLILIPFHNTEARYSLPAMIPLLYFAVHALTAFTTAKVRTSASDSAPPDRFSSTILNEPAASASTQ